MAVLAGVILVVARLRMRERCIGLVVDAWDNPEGGQLPIVSFTTPDGTTLRFLGSPYIGRFGPKYGHEVAVRYNKNKLDVGVAFADSFPTEYLTNPEYIEVVACWDRWRKVRFGAVRIDTFRGSWSAPVGLTIIGLACLAIVASSIIA